MASFNEKSALVAGILAAIGAAACCVGPLVLLALAFRRLYLVPKICTPGMHCAEPRVIKRQRTVFWMVSSLLFGLLAVPWVAPFFY